MNKLLNKCIKKFMNLGMILCSDISSICIAQNTVLKKPNLSEFY
jgi:hypothetical protein